MDLNTSSFVVSMHASATRSQCRLPLLPMLADLVGDSWGKDKRPIRSQLEHLYKEGSRCLESDRNTKVKVVFDS